MAKTTRASKAGMGITGLEATSADKMARDASEVGIGIVALLAAMIGVWGLACLIGGIASEGVLDLATGYLTAITGR